MPAVSVYGTIPTETHHRLLSFYFQLAHQLIAIIIIVVVS